MTDTLSEIKDGEEAKRILDSKVYKNAVNAVREGIVSSMNNSPLGDEKTHNKLVIALQLLGQIERQLKDVMDTGTMAKLQVKEKSGFFS